MHVRKYGDFVSTAWALGTFNQSKYSIDWTHIVFEALRHTINALSSDFRCVSATAIFQIGCHRSKWFFPFCFIPLFIIYLCILLAFPCLYLISAKPVMVWQIQCSAQSHRCTDTECVADGSRKSHYIICSSIWHAIVSVCAHRAAPVTNNIFYTIWFGATFSRRVMCFGRKSCQAHSHSD